MISLKNKFLFVHVPKTGGNSIQNILRDYSEDKVVVLAKHQDGVERFEVRSDKYDITKHSTLSHYKAVLKPGVFRQLFKFATIRNPWDMMISWYFSPHRGGKEWDRDDFMELMGHVSTLRRYITYESFTEKLIRRSGLRIGFKKSLLSNIDFLIRFENINEDFKLVCEKIGVLYSPLPQRNKSIRDHYSRYYDEELKEMVRTKFIEEIEYGNYEFRNA